MMVIPANPLVLREPDESGLPAACRASLGCCCPGSHPVGPTCPVACATCGLSSADRSGVRSGSVRISRALTTPGSLVRWLSVLVPVITGYRLTERACRPLVSALSTMDWRSRDETWVGAVGVGLPSARRTESTRERQPKWGAGDWPPAGRWSGVGAGHGVTFRVAGTPEISPEDAILSGTWADVDSPPGSPGLVGICRRSVSRPSDTAGTSRPPAGRRRRRSYSGEREQFPAHRPARAASRR